MTDSVNSFARADLGHGKALAVLPDLLSRVGYFWLAIVFLSLWLFQQWYHWEWTWLSSWQAQPLYKQMTGFALLGYLYYQWKLSHRRSQLGFSKGKHLIKYHKFLGVLAPLLLLCHTLLTGYGYTNLLVSLFLFITLVGLLNTEATSIEKPWYNSAWLIIHISSTVLLFFLIIYHIYFVITF